MSSPAKTNALAIVSFSSGLLALISTALLLWLFHLQPVPNDMTIIITDSLLIPLRNLGMIAAVATGVLALRQIKQGVGNRKGKILAWIGSVIGIAWFLFMALAILAFLQVPI
ncbi:MAG: DUF4190 domain-containing protein [Roseiflexus sp.]|jgi:hypothetical protein|nr:DUF4190 domain-containing protein [Roseiflexus sp.]MBO9334937.1 DUF4190 domain-containing protein [Roseiflexus sp.]MBO9342623.1 DUF4190 domain-containing protein [Roseiflexus sp.]MBO9365574.1 DUF4190 domain-containing protein [Roseiflexus sp.]MBO9383658.1 DUF4190 domain-containing protein [Roseiflexus sp.]